MTVRKKKRNGKVRLAARFRHICHKVQSSFHIRRFTSISITSGNIMNYQTKTTQCPFRVTWFINVTPVTLTYFPLWDPPDPRLSLTVFYFLCPIYSQSIPPSWTTRALTISSPLTARNAEISNENAEATMQYY